MCYCKKCMVIGGAVFLVLGVVYVLVDLKKFDFWNIQWYSVLFLAMGLGQLGSSKCPDCQAMKSGKK